MRRQYSPRPLLQRFLVATASVAVLFSLSSPGFSASDSVPVGAHNVSGSQSEETPFSLERISKQFPLTKEQKVRIENPWGDIRLSQNGTNELVFHAVVQKIGESPKMPRLVSAWTDESEQELVLQVEYPADQTPASVQEGRVDISVLVPYGAAIEVHAERGRVLTKTMESPLTIRAKDQKVSVKSRSSLDISSEGGDINLIFLAGPSTDRGRIQSYSGDIELRYYRDQALAVEMRSGASKTTNDLTLLQSQKLSGHRASMHKGENPPKIYLQSDTGRIILNDLAITYHETKEEEF